jgi:pimeloyl-ACP methyl ester carboxylesterase
MPSRDALLRAILGGLSGSVLTLWAVAAEPQAVSFNAADGMRIAADYYPRPAAEQTDAPMVILLHMYRSDRKAWGPLIDPLHQAGFAILALDLRGHGESATTETRDAVLSRDTEVFRKVQNDLRGAYDWLAQQPHLDRARFALVGASVGCSIALQYAAKDRSVDAVVCLSPGLNYLGLDSAGDLRQVTGRKILMLATEDERDVPYTLQKGSDGVQVHVYKGAKAHGTDMFGAVPDIEKEIVAFLKPAVGEPAKTAVFGSIESNVYHLPDSGWLERISPTNLRYYSSPQEAEARGLRASKSKGPSQPPTGTDSAGDKRGRSAPP